MLFFILFFFSFFTQHNIGINVIYYRRLPSSGKSAANFSPPPPTRWWDGRQDIILLYIILYCRTVAPCVWFPINRAIHSQYNVHTSGTHPDKDRPKANSIVFASKTGKRVRVSRDVYVISADDENANSRRK